MDKEGSENGNGQHLPEQECPDMVEICADMRADSLFDACNDPQYEPVFQNN